MALNVVFRKKKYRENFSRLRDNTALQPEIGNTKKSNNECTISSYFCFIVFNQHKHAIVTLFTLQNYYFFVFFYSKYVIYKPRGTWHVQQVIKTIALQNNKQKKTRENKRRHNNTRRAQHNAWQSTELSAGIVGIVFQVSDTDNSHDSDVTDLPQSILSVPALVVLYNHHE